MSLRSCSRSSPHPLRAFFSAIFVVSLVLASACVRPESAEVSRPISENLAAYWTCAVFFVTDGRNADANESFELVPWLEARIHERGVFEPLPKEERPDAEVIFRAELKTAQNRVTMRVFLFDSKTNDSLGELESIVKVEAPPAEGQDFQESTRTTALHKAADEILTKLAEERHESSLKPHSKPALPPPPEPQVGPSEVCTTQCQPTAASASSFAEEHRVSLAINDTMKSLRDCLDRVGAHLVEPAVLLRFSPEGELHHVRVDVGGYEQNECVKDVRARMPTSVFTTRARILRCEYHCSSS